MNEPYKEFEEHMIDQYKDPNEITDNERLIIKYLLDKISVLEKEIRDLKK